MSRPSLSARQIGTRPPDTIEASGRGTVYSHVVAHHPPIPPFEYPNVIALIELEEGTRIVSNLVGVDPAAAFLTQQWMSVTHF